MWGELGQKSGREQKNSQDFMIGMNSWVLLALPQSSSESEPITSFGVFNLAVIKLVSLIFLKPGSMILSQSYSDELSNGAIT